MKLSKRAAVKAHNEAYEVLTDAEEGAICERAIEIVQTQWEDNIKKGEVTVAGLDDWTRGLRAIRNRVTKRMNRRSKYDSSGTLR